MFYCYARQLHLKATPLTIPQISMYLSYVPLPKCLLHKTLECFIFLADYYPILRPFPSLTDYHFLIYDIYYAHCLFEVLIFLFSYIQRDPEDQDRVCFLYFAIQRTQTHDIQ